MTNPFAEFTDKQLHLVELYKTNDPADEWKNGFAYDLNDCLRKGSSAMEEWAIALDELVKKWSTPSELTLYRATSDADVSPSIPH